MTVRLFAILAVLLVALAPPADASLSGAQQGEAGLQALSRGANDDAIRLFTAALAAGDLSPQDRELAYLNRGRAYLNKGDQARGVLDLREAVNLDSSDAEAQEALRTALAGAGSVESDAADGLWGLLAKLAGHYYWYHSIQLGPNVQIYTHFEWIVPQHTLAYSVHSKSGVMEAGEYKLDEATGKLINTAIVGQSNVNKFLYGTADVTDTKRTDYVYVNEVSKRETTTLEQDGSLHEHEETFKNGTWVGSDDIEFVEVSRATLEAEGFLKRRRQ